MGKVHTSTFKSRLAKMLARTTPRPRLPDATLELQQAMVRVALARNRVGEKYNMSATARDLGIRRSTLYKLLRQM